MAGRQRAGTASFNLQHLLVSQLPGNCCEQVRLNASDLQGARQQGIKEHVKVKKKHDSTGVGAVSNKLHISLQNSGHATMNTKLILSNWLFSEPDFLPWQVEAITKARDWTAGMAAYDLVLAKMKSVGAANLPAPAPVKTNKKKRKQPEDPSESPVPAAVLHPATAQPTDKPQNKQKKKRKAGNPENAAAVNAAVITPAVKPSTASPPAATEVTTVQQPSEPEAEVTRARGRHVGRYHKTAAAKKAGAYSKSDLAAILGGDSFTAAAPISAATVTVSASSPDLQVSVYSTTTEEKLHELACMSAVQWREAYISWKRHCRCWTVPVDLSEHFLCTVSSYVCFP